MAYKRNKERYDKLNLVHPSNANLINDIGSVSLEISGVPFCVEIKYRGTIFVDSHLGVSHKMVFSENKIRILNNFSLELPELLFTYKGILNITNCDITNYEGFTFKPEIIRNNRGEIFEGAKTNLEDSTLTIDDYDEDLEEATHQSGYVKLRLPPNAIVNGKFNKLEKYDPALFKSFISKHSTIEKIDTISKKIRATRPTDRHKATTKTVDVKPKPVAVKKTKKTNIDKKTRGGKY